MIRNGAGGGAPSADGPPSPPPAPVAGFDGRRDDPAPARESAWPRTRGWWRDAILGHLREHGPTRQADLRDELGIASPAMGAYVSSLEREGLIVRGEAVNRSPLLSLAGGEGERVEGSAVGTGAAPGADAPREDQGGGGGDEHLEAAAEPDEAPAEAPAFEVGEALPRDPVELHFMYLGILIGHAREPNCPEHIFGRISKMMMDGPPTPA